MATLTPAQIAKIRKLARELVKEYDEGLIASDNGKAILAILGD